MSQVRVHTLVTANTVTYTVSQITSSLVFQPAYSVEVDEDRVDIVLVQLRVID